MKIAVRTTLRLAILLLACASTAQAQDVPTDVTDAPDDHGAYLSLVLGNGRIHGGNAEGNRSDALMVGIGRQFGRAEPDPETDPANGRTWFGASIGNSITNMAGTDGARASVLEVRRYLGERLEHWAVSGKFLFEGDDGARVDRRGAAAQLWYVQTVTPRFAMSAGLGPYVARNRRQDNITHGNLLVTFQAEQALSRQARAFLNFNRVKTFRQTDDRDLFQLGLLTDF